MRAALASMLVLALLAPAAAQGKTKTPAVPFGVQVVEVCERFTSGDERALDDAGQSGWDAEGQESDTPFVEVFAGSRTLQGFGIGQLFAFVETYPNTLLGYCRVEVPTPTGDGAQQIAAIEDLDRYTGTSQTTGEGIFASLASTESSAETMLLTHWTDESFVVQMTTITPQPVAAN